MGFRHWGIAFILGLVALTGPRIAYGHGTGYRESAHRSIALEFYYSTGETMSYLETKVFSPKDEKFAYQSGRTDEHGRFAFTPDVEGQWRVAVKDDEGHLAEAVFDVTEDFLEGKATENTAPQVKSAMPEGLDLWIRAILGISLLFNIAALISLQKSRKKDA